MARPIRSRDRKHRITLLEPVSAKDADGRVIQSYIARGDVMANIQHRPGSETFQQARMEARNPATIAILATSLARSITSEWQVETDEVTYEIKGDPFPSQDARHIVFQVEGRRK